jgi:uncharacterized protein DUF4394
MNMKKSKKTYIGMSVLALAIAAIATFVLMGRHSVSAAAAQTMSMPVNIFAMTTNGTLYVLPPSSSFFFSIGRPTGIGGDDPISMDFRPADRKLYMLTDRGRLFTVNFNVSPPVATLVSNLSPRFPSGFQSLFDFNPQVDAIRLIGSNALNYAVVKDANGILNTTAVQTSLTYTAGDVNAGRTPVVPAGAYTNNVANAANTLFYAIDNDLDNLVTIADKVAATGSSNTGGGKLQTIGPLTDINGNPINLNPTVDMDIFTDPATLTNTIVGIDRSGIAFTINVSQINPNLPLGTTQPIAVQAFNIPTSPNHDGSFMEIAVSIP